MAQGWRGPSICYCTSATLPQYVPGGILPGSTSIDVQGFIYWDPTEVTTQGHMYSGWELHPFTAWRLSASLATNRTILGLNPTFFYEMITSLGVAVATTALGLYWKRTRRRLDSTA